MKDELAAAADVVIYNVEHSTKAGMRLILRLKQIDDLKDFERITRFKDGHAGGIYQMILMGDEWGWSGETMFQGWSASHTGGAKLRFLLNDENDVKFLMDVPRGTSASMGMRELDNGEMVDEARKERVESERGGPLAKRAAQLCRDEEFQRWLAIATETKREANTEEACAEWIRLTCRVASRAHLDHSEQAAALFQKDVLGPYVRYLYGTP